MRDRSMTQGVAAVVNGVSNVNWAYSKVVNLGADGPRYRRFPRRRNNG